MKSPLFSFLTLTTLLTTGLSSNVGGNDKICVESPDPGICTVTVVSENQDTQASGSEPGTIERDFVYVLNNKCDSIIDSDDCDDAGLCKHDIHQETAPFSIGVKGKPYTVEINEREGGDIRKHPPLFYLSYADDGADDYPETDSSCTCAHSVHGGYDAQACSCYVRCDQ
ncbi:hypothetical protein PHISCL_09292 [Aspergillus sclerotialis]|uniref:Uncharacterized protein n=1 Tax=Aspergillus sclerotialis TaxID=2070753 RepID=A0A3A2Z5K3_9EURO|nr:hypothetical protein PHISCL_09292 [Aspergillus sclerotialis]